MTFPPRRNDGTLAVFVAVIDILIVLYAGYGYVLSGLSFGAPSPREAQDAAAERESILWFLAWLAGGGFCLAAVFRCWKTAVTHLALVALPLLVGLGFQVANSHSATGAG
ncbi:hypothetical protein [Streptomyces aureocirculatus]|uniref:hypothetical protein n=1 Tax=Streptomyces aureocirculatus TaxID=67275 RepID=UPI000A7EBF7D|nr:hypothetical protein [Streptomyces aureocirculatus]